MEKMIILLLIVSSCTAVDAIEESIKAENYSIEETYILNEIQDYRIAKGVKMLIPNKDFHDEAKLRAKFLDSLNISTHDGYSLVKNNIEALGYQYVTELLTYDYSPENVLKAITESDKGHNESILDSKHQYIGVGYLDNKKKYCVILIGK